MKHNKKILCAAVTAALSLSASTAYADKGKFYVCDADSALFLNKTYSTVGAGNGCSDSPSKTFASELFLGNNPKVPDGRLLRVQYELNSEVVGSDADKGYDFNAIYTLSSGTFGEQVSPSNHYFLAQQTDGSQMSVTAPVGGKSDSNSVTFFIQAKQNAKTTSSPMYFQFTLDDATALATPGAEIKMGLQLIANGRSLPDDGSISDVTVAKSASGVKVDILPAGGIAEISVATGAKEFVGTNTTAKTADLGTLSIGRPGNVMSKDLISEWTLGVSDPKPVGDQSSLTIANGNFAASTTAKGKGRVFLDLDNNSTFGTGDLVANTVEEGEAIWRLTSDNLKNIGAASSVKIVIEADGETAINDFEEQPTATLKIAYGAGDPASYSGRLRQIKRDGTICTLFNVPAPTEFAKDNFNLRITNTSADAGTVLGTLRDEKGAEIFSNQELVNSLAPNATAYLNAAAVQAITKNQAWLDANPNAPKDASGAPTWDGRATLTLAGNLRTMEAYALLREKTPGAPLLNISTGASGNGCQ